MKKKIVTNSILLCILATILGVCASAIIYFNSFEKTMQAQAYSQVKLIENIIVNSEQSDLINTLSELKKHFFGRITFLDLYGNVQYDTDFDAYFLESHSDRQEIVTAMQLGAGTAKRRSDTSGQTTYYCALKIENLGVIRVGIHASQLIQNIIIQTLPIIILFFIGIIALCYLLAKNTTQNIVKTIDNYDIDNPSGDIYDELAPFILKINKQNKIIKAGVENIKTEKEKLEQVFANIQEAIIVCNDVQEITQYNKKAKQIFQIENLNDNLYQYLRNIPLQKAVQKAIDGQTQKGIIEYDNKHYKYVINPNNNYTFEKGAIIILLDITEQVESENMRRQFTDSVTHELKTPLTSILGYTQLITSGIAKQEDILNFANIIENNAQNLMQLIQDIIKISNLDQGFNIEKTHINLSKIWIDTIDNLSIQLNNKSINITTDIQDITLLANENAMYDIASNLVQNAINYNNINGDIDIKIKKQNNNAVITISDTGIGIANKDIPKIFQRFYVVDKSRNKNISSSGLGLSIVKHAVNVHNGSIKVASKLGAGTTFTIKLPINN